MSEVNIRICTNKDCKYIYSLANDNVYRNNSINSDYIEYEDHLKWFEKSMKDPIRYIYIVQFNGKDMGQIRIDIIEDTNAQISYMIEEKYRNKGIGTKLLAITKEKIISDFKNIKMITAKVKKENIASRKAFNKNGYLEKELDYYYYEYSLMLKI